MDSRVSILRLTGCDDYLNRESTSGVNTRIYLAESESNYSRFGGYVWFRIKADGLMIGMKARKRIGESDQSFDELRQLSERECIW